MGIGKSMQIMRHVLVLLIKLWRFMNEQFKLLPIQLTLIWLHYCTFATTTFGDPDTIRRIFEQGLAYVGTDYLSFPLWDRYIDYEFMQQAWGQLVVIYSRILENPNQQLDRYLNSFKELAGSRPLSELRTTEEAAAAAAAASATSEDGVQANGVSLKSVIEAENLRNYFI